MAVNDAILVSTTGKSLGQQVVAAANQLRAVKGNVNDLASIFAHLTDGATFATLEAQLGLAAGQGAVLYALVNTLQTQINGSSAVTDFSSKVISVV